MSFTNCKTSYDIKTIEEWHKKLLEGAKLQVEKDIILDADLDWQRNVHY